MRRTKIFATVICSALIVAMALPGTLAVSSDQDGTDSNFTVKIDSEEQTEDVRGEKEQAEDAQEEKEQTEDVQETEAVDHMESCSEDCEDEDCTCGCHLYDKLMACSDIEKMWTIIDESADETIEMLTDDQKDEIEAKLDALEPAPAPAIVIEETTETVQSEIGYEMISFTDVAPIDTTVAGENR